MLLLMDTIAIAGGVHHTGFYEQALLSQRKRDALAPPSRLRPRMRQGLSSGLFMLGSGLQRLARKICTECHTGVRIRSGEARTA